MPTIHRVLETALYCDDLDRAAAFYRDVLGLAVLAPGPRLIAMDAGQSTVLLLLKRGASKDGVQTPDHWLPPHDGSGPLHMAFAVAAEDLPAWEERLATDGVAIEGRIRWELGGSSIYFRDPDGHLIELATPGVWATY